MLLPEKNRVEDAPGERWGVPQPYSCKCGPEYISEWTTRQGCSGSIGILWRIEMDGWFDFADCLADAAIGAGNGIEPEDATVTIEKNCGGPLIDGEGFELGIGNDEGGEFHWQRGAKRLQRLEELGRGRVDADVRGESRNGDDFHPRRDVVLREAAEDFLDGVAGGGTGEREDEGESAVVEGGDSGVSAGTGDDAMSGGVGIVEGDDAGDVS